MKILLAEDDPKVASFITNGLSENGHSVDHVTDGREALTYCLYNSCDLAILDRMMPGMDGLSVVRAPIDGAGKVAGDFGDYFGAVSRADQLEAELDKANARLRAARNGQRELQQLKRRELMRWEPK